MTLVSRMIARRILATSLTVFAVLIGLAATTQVLNQVFRIIDAAGGVWIVMQLMLLFLPNVMAVTLPLAWLVGLMAAYDSLRDNGEAVILSGTGRSPMHLFRPAVTLSVVVSGLMLLSSLVVEPAANRRLADLILSLRYEALTILTGDSVLREVQSDLFVRGGLRGADADMQGFFLFDRRDAPSETLYVAEDVQLNRDARGAPLVEMLNGRLIVKTGGPGASYSAAFGTYRFSPEYFFSNLSAGYGPRERSTAALLSQVQAGEGSDRAWRELRRRLTDWLYPLAFCAIAAWVTIRADTAGRGRAIDGRWTMAVALAIGAAARIAGLTLAGVADQPGLALAIAAGVPLGSAVVFALLAITAGLRLRPPRQSPLPA